MNLSENFIRRPVMTVRNSDSPFWIGNLRNSEFRCLVPATEVMLWGAVDPATGRRRQLWLSCADQPLFALAGVWKDSEVASFALLTCPANAALREQGVERMPVILPPASGAQHAWLLGGWERAATLIAPYSSHLSQWAEPLRSAQPTAHHGHGLVFRHRPEARVPAAHDCVESLEVLGLRIAGAPRGR